MNELVRHLSSTLPSLSLKTSTFADSLLTTSAFGGLEVPLDSLQSGTPVLFLDCCERPALPESLKAQIEVSEWSDPTQAEGARAELIAWGKGTLEKEDADRRAAGLKPDTQSEMHLAWFHEILNGDGHATTVEAHARRRQRAGRKGDDTLHAAIKRVESGSMAANEDGALLPATSSQRDEALRWFADHMGRRRWLRFGPHESSEAAKGGLTDRMDDAALEAAWQAAKTADTKTLEKNAAARMRSSALLGSPNFHGVNLRHAPPEDTKRLVEGLVRLDRLPAENPAEGLQLLRQVWNEHDVAMHLAGYYKMVAKAMFLLSLVLSFTVVTLSTISGDATIAAGTAVGKSLQEVVFGVSVAVASLASLEAFVDARAKWRHLRTFAGMLASIVWQYRTRVAPFDTDAANPESQQPEGQLRNALIAWRRELAAGADLNRTVLRKRYPDHVYKHQQQEGGKRCAGDAAGDDHFSPVQAHE